MRIFSALAKPKRAKPAIATGQQNTPYRWFISFMLAVIAGAIAWTYNPMRSADAHHADRTLTSSLVALDDVLARPVAVVAIDAADIAQFGGPPVSRNVVAQALDRLQAEGAHRILVDLVFSAPMQSADDTALIAALQRLGPQRVALASGLNAGLLPDEIFTENLPVIDTNIFADRDGWSRSLGGTHRVINPANWLAHGSQNDVFDGTATPIDQRLDPASLRSFSLKSLLDGLRGTHNLDGALVVLTQSTQIGAPRVYLPGYGETNCGVLIALATASTLTGQQERAGFGDQAATVLAALGLTLGFFAAVWASTLRVTAAAGLTIAGTLFTASLYATQMFASPGMGYTSVMMVVIGLVIACAHRMRIAALLRVFLKGDVSPEEAALWSANADRGDPVFLLSGNGSIKRANPSATQILNGQQDKSLLPRLLMPNFGERSDRLDLEANTFALDWPSHSLPLVTARDITQQANQESALRAELVTDGLTQLLNRHGFNEKLAQAAADKRTSYAVFYMDMNGFKAVNDTYGHDAGDELLILAARAFENCVRAQDSVARLGGDEFAVLAPGNWTAEDAAHIAAKLEDSLREPITLDAATVQVGVAVGIAQPNFAGEPVSKVMKHGDHAMYARKAQIKGTPSLRAQAA